MGLSQWAKQIPTNGKAKIIMTESNLRLFFIFIIAFLMAFSSTPIVSMLAGKIGAIDVPNDERRAHSKPIPRLGGLAIFYGFIVAVLCLSEIDMKLQGILIGSVIIVIVGIMDDMMDLNAFVKLFFQIIAAVIVVMHGVTIEIFTNPFMGGQYIPLGLLSIPITIIWIVGITNAVNLVDGLDGLAVGISSITAMSIFFISLIMGEYTISLLTAALVGACFGFLPFNFYPAKIFMGDTGSTFLGFVLASISIMGLFKVYAVLSFAVPFIVLGLPIFDTVFAIIRRLKNGQSPMQPDRGHLHHRLIDMGFSQKRAVMILYTTSGLLSLSAVVMMFTGSFFRTLILIVAVLILIVAGANFYITARNMAKSNEESQ